MKIIFRVLRKIFKKFLFVILNLLSDFIPVKQNFDLKDLNIIILLRKPLGIGDLIMLSPFVKLLEEQLDNKLYIVTEYDGFINFNKVKYLKPDKISNNILSNSLIISPTLVFSHLKYIFKAKYFLGYFVSNKLISNFSKKKYKYNPKKDHYLERTFPILDVLHIKYNPKNFKYPNLIDKRCKIIDENNRYVVIAPYSKWSEKQYPKDKYVEILRKILANFNLKIVLIGSGATNEIIFNKEIENTLNNSNVINLTGQTNIFEMINVIKNATLYIGNDSGPSHVAYLTCRRSLVFFGPVKYENILPLNKHLRKNIVAVDNRSSCIYFPCYDGYNKPICKNQDKYSCIHRIDLRIEDLSILLQD